MRKALAFDDVLVVPGHCKISSRDVVDLQVHLTDHLKLGIPIIAANMATICNDEMAIAMAKLGGLGIIHRMQTIPEQATAVETARKALGEFTDDTNLNVGAAVGLNDLERALECERQGANVICIDVAHGDSSAAIDTLKALLDKLSAITTVVFGNIATPEALVRINKDIPNKYRERLVIKVGIGGGSMCTTRIQTGCGMPTLQSILDIRSQHPRVSLIADGGIRTSGDIVKALAAGADVVMLGGLLAGTKETPGELMDGPSKLYRGSASDGSKRAFYGEARYVEGTEAYVPYKGPVTKIIAGLLDGIRSGCSYIGCERISGLYHHCELVEITSAGMQESRPHGTLNK